MDQCAKPLEAWHQLQRYPQQTWHLQQKVLEYSYESLLKATVHIALVIKIHIPNYSVYIILSWKYLSIVTNLTRLGTDVPLYYRINRNVAHFRYTNLESSGRWWHCSVCQLHHSYTTQHSQTLAACSWLESSPVKINKVPYISIIHIMLILLHTYTIPKVPKAYNNFLKILLI